MRITPPTTEDLDVGDRITISVTHHIRINQDESWVRYEASTTRRESETTTQADARLLHHVDAFVIQACQQVAATVEEHQ